MSNAGLSGADLSEADLSGADLSGAGSSGADLSGADLSGAGSSGADSSEADSSGLGLSEEFAISVKGVSKQYHTPKTQNKTLALEDVTLHIPYGTIYGLLGVNGAGKSTLISVISGAVRKSSGKVWVNGYDMDTQSRLGRAHLGIVPQEMSFDPFFTPYEILELHAGLYGLPATERHSMFILKLLSLEHKKDAYTRSLSGGMKKRLQIGKALVHSPPIIILDEPTAGVDITLRHELWENIRLLQGAGVTILLTTHYLAEAESLCEKIAILHEGKIIADDYTSNMLNYVDNKKLQITVKGDREINDLAGSFSYTRKFIVSQDITRFTFKISMQSDDEIRHILQHFHSEDLHIMHIDTQESDLEEIFINLTNQSHED